MDQTGIFYVLCSFTMFCVFLSGFCLLLFLRNNTRLKEISQRFDGLVQKIRTIEDFKNASDNLCKNHIGKEELKNRFETIPALKTSVSDKYRHVAQLERSGLGVREVAEILDVSHPEAEQMLSLARLSKRG